MRQDQHIGMRPGLRVDSVPVGSGTSVGNNAEPDNWRVPLMMSGAGIAFVVALSWYVLGPHDSSVIARWFCLGVFYAIFAIKVLIPSRVLPHLPSYITPTSLFLVFSYVVFYWPYQADVLGMFSLSSSRWIWNTFPEEANRALLLTTMGFLAFFIGSLIPARRLPSRGRSVNTSERDAYESESFEVSRVAPAVTLLLGAAIPAYMLSGLRSAGEGRYSGTTAGGSAADGLAALITLLSMISCALLIATLAQRTRPGFWVWAGLGLAIFWALRLVSSGDRNNATLIFIVLVAGLATFCVRLRLWAVIVILFTSFVLYNAIEVVRHGEVSVEAVISAIVDPPPSDDGGESSFNISNITVRAAVAAAPDVYDYGFGRYFAISALGIVPFARGLLDLGGGADVSSSVLNSVMLRPGASWGVGTSVIADSYLELGVLGVVLVMFAIGKIVTSAERWIARSPASSWRITFFLLIAAIFAELPRYSVGYPVRPLVWALLLLGLLKWLSNQGDRHRLRSTVENHLSDRPRERARR